MKKWVCPVCGYVYEGENPPAECPVCHVSGDKFTLQAEEKTWAAEHVVGVGKVFGEDVPAEVREEIIAGLRANFEGECSEVGMYLAMARVAHREGYPEIGMYWEKAGLEEAEHAAKFAELLGEVVTDSTQKNLQMRVDAENGATAGKFELAKLAKKYNLDAIHDTVHEMARDEARHGKAFEGLLKRYFGKWFPTGVFRGKRKNPLPLFSLHRHIFCRYQRGQYPLDIFHQLIARCFRFPATLFLSAGSHSMYFPCSVPANDLYFPSCHCRKPQGSGTLPPPKAARSAFSCALSAHFF